MNLTKNQMEHLELLSRIKKRPGMYLSPNICTFATVIAMIRGIELSYSLVETKNNSDYLFDDFLQEKFNMNWQQYMSLDIHQLGEKLGKVEHSKIAKYFEYLDEYIQKKYGIWLDDFYDQ